MSSFKSKGSAWRVREEGSKERRAPAVALRPLATGRGPDFDRAGRWESRFAGERPLVDLLTCRSFFEVRFGALIILPKVREGL